MFSLVTIERHICYRKLQIDSKIHRRKSNAPTILPLRIAIDISEQLILSLSCIQITHRAVYKQQLVLLYIQVFFLVMT